MADNTPPLTDSGIGQAILGIYMSTMAIGIVLVSLRLWVRFRITNNFGWDDGCITVAMVATVLGAAFMSLGVQYGLGQHEVALPDPVGYALQMGHWLFSYQIINIVSINMIKVSVALFILRIRNDRPTRIVIWTTIALMTAVNFMAVMAVTLQCTPPAKLWTPALEGSCMPPGELPKFGYAQSIVSVITDGICTLSPVIILWKVRIGRFQKVGICALMSVGLMATVCNLIRTVWLTAFATRTDVTYALAGTTTAALLENNLGIIAACIPTLQPLFRSKNSGSNKTLTRQSRHTRNSSDYQNLQEPFSSSPPRTNTSNFRNPLGHASTVHGNTKPDMYGQDVRLEQIAVSRTFDVREENRRTFDVEESGRF